MKKIWLGIVAIVVLFIAIELNAQEEATNVVYVDDDWAGLPDGTIVNGLLSLFQAMRA